MIRWLLFGQSEELHERLLRFDFGSGSPHIPHFKVDVSGCRYVNEIKASGKPVPALVPGLLTVQVEVCVFEDVV